MRQWQFVFTILVALLLLNSGCNGVFRGNDFEGVVAEIQENLVASDPFIYDSSNPRILNLSPKNTNEWFELAKQYRTELIAFDTANLVGNEKAQFDALLNYLNISLQRDSFMFHDYAISHLYGPHLSAPKFFEQKTIETRKDLNTYLDDLNDVEVRFGELVDGLEHRRKLGVVLPSFILRKVIAQCDSFAELPAEDCPFIRSFETKLAKIDLSEDEKKVLQAKCTETVSGSVNTGYKRLAAYLRQLEHQSVSVAGVWQLPKGEDYYGFTLRYYCGVENNPRQLYDLGKTQLAAIEGELAILNSMNGNGEEKAIEQDADPTESMQFRCYYAGLQLYEQYARIVSESSVDPSEKATYLRTDQLSTIKLMVDIGIHQKQWLREQAVMFIKEHSNLTDLEAQQLVDEIVVKPGYYAAPKIVLMHLIELQQGRSAAEFLEELKEAGPTPLIRLQKPVSSSVEEV